MKLFWQLKVWSVSTLAPVINHTSSPACHVQPKLPVLILFYHLKLPTALYATVMSKLVSNIISYFLKSPPIHHCSLKCSFIWNSWNFLFILYHLYVLYNDTLQENRLGFSPIEHLSVPNCYHMFKMFKSC